MEKMFLVAGWFYQEGVKINLNPHNGLPFIYRTDDHWICHGCFVFHHEQAFQGTIFDACGMADVQDASLVDGRLVFDKCYTHRPDVIHYELRLNPITGLYHGTYEGDLVGRGNARLQLTPPPPDFFVE